MDTIQFVNCYDMILDEMSNVIKDEYQIIIDEMREIDPHDLISPDCLIPSVRDAKGFVWSIFMRKVHYQNSTK